MQTKQWYQSVTVWFNIVMILVATIQSLSSFIPLNPEFLLYVAGAGNFFLRFKTVIGISTTTSPVQQ